MNCSFVFSRWGSGTEVWFLNTSALLLCSWLTQAKIKFWFHHCREPFAFWLSHWLFDRKHIVFSFTSPGQSHHGFFWNVCQSDHYFSTLMICPWFLSFCCCTVKDEIYSLNYYLTSGCHISAILIERHEYFQGTLDAIEIIENKNVWHFIYL